MQDRRLLVTAIALVAFGVMGAFIAIGNASSPANAGLYSTPIATPCPIHTVPDPEGEGCIKVTQTVTPTPIPCATDTVYDPYIHACVPIPPTRTPCPPDYEPGPKGGCVLGTPPGFSTDTPTACPTHQFPVDGACATITPTPTSQRPYGAQVTLVDHYPSPALAGFKKTWVFEIENVGSAYGCKAHEVSLNAQLTGQSITDFFHSKNLGCHETAQIAISAFVTIPFGQTITVTARAQAGAAQGNTIEVSDTVDNPPPPTVGPTVTPFRLLGDFNCDSMVNAIDAAIILQIEAGMVAPLPCTGDGDVNHDGELDSIDAALILQYTAGLINTFD